MSFSKIIIPLIILGLAVGGYFYINKTKKTEQKLSLKTTIQKNPFTVKVFATGELKAKHSEKIMGPQGMRAARIWQTTISDMVSEGTVVKKGDYIASLDKTEITDKIRDAQTEIEKIETQLAQAKIDTTIELRALRDQLVNIQFSKKEKLLQVEQSKYEAPSVIQQAKIDLERATREFTQLQTKYTLTQEKSAAQIAEINASLKQNQGKMTKLMTLAGKFTVTAPKDGMVIYARSWNGKVGPGSQLQAWNPIVAELPDLSDMVSKTYVNEVDISRVKKGQETKIKVDAFPDVEYTGKVLKVANIGEQLRGYDAKVFEVTVQINESDSILRPAMTTGIEIVTNIYEDVIAIPLEALYIDSLNFVYKETASGIVKQEVVSGETNEDEVMIDYGLEENDVIFLSTPSGADDLKFIPLTQEIKDKIKRQQEADAAARKARLAEKSKQIKDEQIDDNATGGGGIVIFN